MKYNTQTDHFPLRVHPNYNIEQGKLIIRILFILLIYILIFASCTSNKSSVSELENDSFKIVIDNKGSFSNYIDVKSGKDYLSNDTSADLMSIRLNHKVIPPHSAELKDDTIILKYTNSISAYIKIEQKKSHFTFELLSITNSENVDLIIWGPYPIILNKVIGETVGVVQGEDYAIGIQSLNPKTLGGYPWQENDCLPQIDIFDQDDPSDINEEGKRYVLYRVEAAKRSFSGSSLQSERCSL